MSKKIDRTGEINYNRNGKKMTIVKYNNTDDIYIKFEDSNELIHTRYSRFKFGRVSGNYRRRKNKVNTTTHRNKIKYYGEESNIHTAWIAMIDRCYNDDKRRDKNTTYKDCKVCEEWLDFNNFLSWYKENYYTVNNEVMCLDKDILHKGNKIYSPKNCIFVPERINLLFTKRQNDRGKYPIGVYCNKKDGVFTATCRIKINGVSTSKYIGRYSNPEDAFYLGYKPFKENYIKQVADEYREKIPNKLYEALYNYKVEITD